jgi:hypothetical protein
MKTTPDDAPSNRLEWLLFFAVALVIYEGAVRKWLLPEAGIALLLLKDLALIGVGVLAWPRLSTRPLTQIWPPWFGLVLAAYLAWAALRCFSADVPSVAISAIGFRAHVFGALLVLLVPAIVTTRAAIERFLWRALLLLVIPVCLLGVLQFLNPEDLRLNRYAIDDADAIARFGSSGFVRVTGSFSYISGMVSFVTWAACVLLGLALAKALGNFGGWRTWVVFAAFGCVTIVMPMTGSRAALVAFALGALAAVVVALALGRMSLRGSTLLLAAGLGLVLVGGERLNVITGAFAERAEGSGGWVDERVALAVRELPGIVADAGLIGHGSGSAHQLAPQFGGPGYWWLPRNDVEDENGRVALELGLVGLLLFFALKISLPLTALWLMRASTSRIGLAIGTATLAFCVPHLFLQLVYNTTAQTLYWLMLGLVLAARVAGLAPQPAITRGARDE